jgi:hypothetical protein
MTKTNEELLKEKALDLYYAKEFESLPESKIYTVLASSIEPNKFHKGEFVMKQIIMDDNGNRFKRLFFIEKSHVKRIKQADTK